MRCLPLLGLLLTLACADATAQSPIVVADGRGLAAEPEVDYSTLESHSALAAARSAARAHWASSEGFEEDFRVMAAAEGAFTQAEASQRAVLYLMSLWPRCCPKLGIAVLEGDRLVHNATFEGVAQRLAAVPDLDGDGLDELALFGAFGMGGQQSESVTLVRFTEDAFAPYGSFSIYDGACAAMHDGETASRVLALPGPSFKAERFTRATCDAEGWEAAGAAEDIKLDPTDITYVALPVR